MHVKQTGVALITVMLILSLATVTAVSMASRQNIEIHRTSNVHNFEQASHYITLIENYANDALSDHFNTAGVPTLSSVDIDRWNNATIASNFTVDEVKMSGEIEDVQARFNLNSLINVKTGAPVAVQVARLRTLINNLNRDINLDLNVNFVDALIDWLDPNSNVVSLSGAEDGVYLRLDVPYLPANQYLKDISELLLIHGMTHDIYKKFIKYVCVLESSMPLNINSAKVEVLQSLNPAITNAVANTLYTNARQKVGDVAGYTSVTAFLADPAIAGLGVSADGLDFTSQSFVIKSSVALDKVKMRFITHLHPDVTSGNISVKSRSRNIL